MVKESISNEQSEMLIISAAIEADINELESMQDRKEFLSEMGLDEPGVNKVIKSAKKEKCNLVIATPPCQGMSVAGKMDKNDPRNTLIIS